MKLLWLLAGAAAAQDVFVKYYAQNKASSIKLDDQSFTEVTPPNRDYSVAILFTALPSQYGCALCRQIQPEFDIVARSWARGDRAGASRTLFGTLDFPDGKAAFGSLQLQTAPVLLLFRPASSGDKAPQRMELTHGFVSPWALPVVMAKLDSTPTAEDIHGWLSRHLPNGPHPPLRRPLNYSRITILVTLALGAVSVVTLAGPHVLPLLQNRNLWAAVSLITILAFTSGHMFNHIRKVPYISGDGHGGISYFAGGFGNQFGLETQIIAALYGMLSFAAIALAFRVPRMADPKSQQVAVVLWSGVMFGLYAFLLNIFKIKNPGYPFRLPPL